MFMFVFFVYRVTSENAKVINSIINLRELALIKQKHCYAIIYVHRAHLLSRFLCLRCGS